MGLTDHRALKSLREEGHRNFITAQKRINIQNSVIWLGALNRIPNGGENTAMA